MQIIIRSDAIRYVEILTEKRLRCIRIRFVNFPKLGPTGDPINQAIRDTGFGKGIYV